MHCDMPGVYGSDDITTDTCKQGLSQDLETGLTGCPKLAIVKFLGVYIFKGDHNILRFQPLTYLNSSK